MPRNRVIYNSQAFYCSRVSSNESQVESGSVKQLSRIQSFSESFDINYLNINQFGSLHPIGRLIAESPIINGGFSYYLTDGGNEALLGFNVDTNISGNTILPQSIYSAQNVFGSIIESEIGLNFYNNTNEISRNWQDIAMSNNGNIQVAVATNAPIKISYDYGLIWSNVASSRTWTSIEISKNGQYILANSIGGVTLKSSNYGQNWGTLFYGDTQYSKCVAISYDGKVQTIPIYGGQYGILVSTDFGNSWSQKPFYNSWEGVAMSSDGNIQAATTSQDTIWMSFDSGDNWSQINSVPSQLWGQISMSDNGQYISAVRGGGEIWVSNDFGSTWESKTIAQNWQGICMSSDGKYQTATTNNGGAGKIWNSSNYGQTWSINNGVPNSNQSLPWGRGAAMSSNGRYQSLVANFGAIWRSVAGINTSQISKGGTSFVNDILQNKSDEKNYYLSIIENGPDHNLRQLDSSIKTGVIGLGNGYITSYNIEAGVGSLPIVTVDIDGLNINVYNNISGNVNRLPSIDLLTDKIVDNKFFNLPNPSIDLYSGQVSVLNPGDIILNIPDALGFSVNDLKIQNFSINLNLDRKRQQKIGRRYPISREINFPSFATIEINADAGDLSSGTLNQLFCSKPTYDFNIVINKPCKNSTAIIFNIKDARLISQNFASAFNINSNIDLTYEVQIDAPFTMNRGLFVSGTYDLNILN